MEGTQPTQPQRALPRHWKDACLAVSLANLCFAETWAKINYSVPFLMPYWSWVDLAAMVVNLLALGAVFFLLFYISRTWRWRRWEVHALLYLIPIFVLLNLFRRSHPAAAGVFTNYHQLIAAFAILAVLAVAGVVAYRRRIVPLLEALIMGMLVLIPSNFVYAAWVISRQDPVRTLAAPLPAKPNRAPRVVWIIFDETDWRIAFAERPASLRLPNFDALRSTSFFAENAFQAGADTIEAMPALVSGSKVRTATPAGKKTLWLKAAPGDKPVDWATEPNVFAQAHELGYNVGIVGWFLPYCRIFHSALTYCHWESMNTGVLSTQPDFRRSLWAQIRGLTPMESRFRQVGRYQDLLSLAKESAADPQLGFMLLHLSVPHGPAAYDRERQRLTPWNFQNDWYVDNLALADRALGEIRDAMEKAGAWDRTTVIVSSDHALRPSTATHPHPDTRVPYMIKAAGQQTGSDYPPAFNARLTKDLILAVLRADLRTDADILRWFSAQPPQTLPQATRTTD